MKFGVGRQDDAREVPEGDEQRPAGAAAAAMEEIGQSEEPRHGRHRHPGVEHREVCAYTTLCHRILHHHILFYLLT